MVCGEWCAYHYHPRSRCTRAQPSTEQSLISARTKKSKNHVSPRLEHDGRRQRRHRRRRNATRRARRPRRRSLLSNNTQDELRFASRALLRHRELGRAAFLSLPHWQALQSSPTAPEAVSHGALRSEAHLPSPLKAQRTVPLAPRHSAGRGARRMASLRCPRDRR